MNIVYVAVKSYRKDDLPECVGVWADRSRAITEISQEYYYNEDENFSHPEDGWWGTTEWSISLTEQKISI